MRWDEERFGREYDLDTFMIFCADDFNIGAMENKGLNIFNSRLLLADPATATDDDFSAIEAVIGARILPQLDRQPRHVPRLVPAVAEGGPHRLSRPGVLERPGLARRRAHRRCRVPATRAVRRGRRPDGAPGAPGRVRGDQQLLYGYRLRKGRRADPDAARAARRAGFRGGHGSLLRAPRRTGGHLRRVRAVDAGCVRRRSRAVPQLVFAGRNAGGHRARQLRCAGAGVRAGRRAERARPSTGSRRTPPLHVPLAIGLIGPDGRDMPLRLAGEPAVRSARRGSSSSRQRRSASSSSTWPPLQCRRCCAGFRRRCEWPTTTTTNRSHCSRRTTATLSTAGMRRSACSPTRSCASRDAHRGGAPLLLPPVLARVVRQILGDDASDPSLLALALATARCRVCRVARTGDRSGRDRRRDRYIERALAASLRDDFVERLSALPAPRSLRVGARHRQASAAWPTDACVIWACSTTMPRTRS